MELTKAEYNMLKPILRKGILRGCQKWLDEMDELIRAEYTDEENAFDRCMHLTRESRAFFKEANSREHFYSKSSIVIGISVLLREGNLTWDDLSGCSQEILTDLHSYVDFTYSE